MRKLTMYQTRDTQLFNSFESATKHAANCYGFAVTSLSHEIVKIEKYADAIAFIQNNLIRFGELLALKEDALLENPEEEEGE